MVQTRSYDQKVIDRVLSRVAAPHYVDLTSPFISGEKHRIKIDTEDYDISSVRPSVLKGMLHKMEHNMGKPEDLKVLAMESHELEKAGPMSLRPHKAWWSDTVKSYQQSPGFHPHIRSLELAQDKIWRRIGPCLSKGYFSDPRTLSFPKTTFSGMPWCTRTDKILEQLFQEVQVIMDDLRSGRFVNPYPSLMGWRGQSKGWFELPKQRVVWMYPKAPVVVSLSWLRTVIPHLRLLTEFVGWNAPDQIDRQIMTALDIAYRVRSNVISADYSAFDTSVTPGLVRPYFERLEMSNLLLPILDDFFSSPLAYPGGTLHRVHGVPSGHGWTNFVDCLANLTCIYYIAERTGCNVQFATALGDDSVCVFSKPVPLNEMSAIAAELGLKLNADKSIESMDEAHFLQKLYLRGGVQGGIRSVIRTLNHMITFERFIPEMSREYLEARTWSQLQEVEFNPFRFLLLDWVKSHDDMHLMLDRPDAHEVVTRVIRETDLNEKSRWMYSWKPPSSFWFAGK